MLNEYTQTIGDMLNNLKHSVKQKAWLTQIEELIPANDEGWTVKNAKELQNLCSSIEEWGNDIAEYAEKMRYAAEDIELVLKEG